MADVTTSLKLACFTIAAICLLAWPAAGQVQFGDLSTDLNGTISTGYTADYGNQINSSHAWTVGGSGNLSGSFYNPNFLSFNVSPYYNQSRANSNYQSISDASGVNVSSNLFSGSNFPGSISYAKAYNSEGNYAIPGAANYVTHGNSDSFGINWSEHLPDEPSLSAGFVMGSNQYSVYGTNDMGSSGFHSFNLSSAYTLAGFNMGAYYTVGASHAQIPQVVAGEQVTETHSDNSAYGFNVGHALPLHGSASAGINRSSYNSDYLGTSIRGTIDTVNAAAMAQPTNKLHFSVSANYSDNLSGQLVQSVVAAGGVVPGANSSEGSHAWDFLGTVSYALARNLQTSAFGERRTQSFLGQTYGTNSLGGSATYGHELLGGNFNGSLSVSDNTADNSSVNALGLSTNANYSRRILGWNVSGSFGYAQNVQTLLVTYTNSFYDYSGNIRRRFGNFNFNAGASGARTGLTQQPGTGSHSESFHAGAGYSHWLTASGNYTKSSGQALVTGAGLVPVPVPSPILPSSLVSLYGGKSYSFALASTPRKRLTIAATYSKSNSNTFSNAQAYANQNEQYNVLIQYQFRKMNFISGYSRLRQGFSGSSLPPEMISSYYFGVSRWFNFF